MKILLKTLFVALTLTLIASCSKDSDSVTEPPIVIVPKTKLTINKIEVLGIPAYNNGLLWDATTNPDVYAKFYDENNDLIFVSSTIYNFTPTVANSFLVNFTGLSTTDLINTVLKVEVWDEDQTDAIPNEDDKIGEVSFYINEYTVGNDKYQTVDVKTIYNTTVAIYMTWE